MDIICGILLAFVRTREVGVSSRNVVSRSFPHFSQSMLTPMYHASLHHRQRRSVNIRQDGQHTHDVRVWYVRMPAHSTHSVGMLATPFWMMVIWVPRWNRQGVSVVVLCACSSDRTYLFVPFRSFWLMAFRMCRSVEYNVDTFAWKRRCLNEDCRGEPAIRCM